ncbi:TetR/AcrR family transcriptional regulator [Kocuria sp. TGY1127_2]|uniref:TetR/AcrR family transcriptional regulator n=1 Tax=Kocuria sp. TGY1127_2 TaxID=2711328 RepID=UPI0015C1732E|nr:TetR/AcrR family transcriptional regulator [Kocuria sp. TGY1127_2]
MQESSSKIGTTPPAPERPLRADAQRNRERLIKAATHALTDKNRSSSLEAIAGEAGVGIGTLYRHFPTRDALVEAVYATQLDALQDEAEDLSRRLPGDQALREWAARHARFAATKHGMLDAIRTELSTPRPSRPLIRRRVAESVELLLRTGVADGTLRGDVEADDVAVLLLGIFLATARAGRPEQECRLRDLALDALRVR